MFSLMPRETVFFDLFEEAARNVHRGAEALAEVFRKWDNIAERAKKIKDIEHAGDDLTHRIAERLNKTFITPLDREDIHAIASGLDDILDFIDTTASRLVMYEVPAPLEDAVALADCLVSSSSAVVDAIQRLRDLRDPNGVLKQCVVIHALENKGDQIAQRGLATLFKTAQVIDIIKWKDIYQDLETATDRCEDVANVLEAVVIKNG